jgi:hypothetical protein
MLGVGFSQADAYGAFVLELLRFLEVELSVVALALLLQHD